MIRIVDMRLEGYGYRRIAKELNLSVSLIKHVLDAVHKMLESRGAAAARLIRNRGLRFFRIESRAIYSTDPPELLEALERLRIADESSNSPEEFIEKAKQIVDYYNKKLKLYGIELKLRKGSPFEKRGRPYALRIRRKKKGW